MQALNRQISFSSLLVLAGALALACGSKGTDDAAGGASSGGGGGATAAGGATAGGGAPVAGASAAGSGTVAGATAAGGAAAGGAAAGGAPGGGGAAAITKTYSFDTTVESWKIQYTSSGLVAGMMAPLIALTNPELTSVWTDTDGKPAAPPGALQIGIPYSTASQYVGVGISLPVKVDLTDKVLRANVKIVSGLGSAADLVMNPGGAKLYVKTGAGYVYAAGTYTNLPAIGTWIPVEFDLLDPSYIDESNPAAIFDRSDVREIGIQLDTSGTSTTAMPAVVLIDGVAY